MRKKFANLLKPALLIGAVIQRLFIFKISILDIWLNPRFAWIGFQILTFDNMEKERSLFAIVYHNFDRRLFINVLFFNKQWFV